MFWNMFWKQSKDTNHSNRHKFGLYHSQQLHLISVILSHFKCTCIYVDYKILEYTQCEEWWYSSQCPWPRQHIPGLDHFKSPGLWAKSLCSCVSPSESGVGLCRCLLSHSTLSNAVLQVHFSWRLFQGNSDHASRRRSMHHICHVLSICLMVCGGCTSPLGRCPAPKWATHSLQYLKKSFIPGVSDLA